MTSPLSHPPGWWQQSTIRRFLKWLVSWRTARRLLVGAACLVTAHALFCTEENIRGKRAWERYRREAEARGEQLDFAAFIPKPVPDEQNFAATPLVRSWFRKENMPASDKLWNDSFSRAEARMRMDRGRRFMDIAAWAMALDDTNPRWRTEPGKLEGRHLGDVTAWGMAFEDTEPGKREGRRLTDVAAWGAPDNGTNPSWKIEPGKLDPESRAQAAPAVLEALKTDEAIFAELRAASQRPDSRYPVNYDVENPFTILLPHLSSVRAVCRRLQLRACAELADGRSAEALTDVKLMLRLVDSMKEETFLIDYLVRVACLQTAIEPVWEGLAEHRWSDAQLHELQARLQRCDFVADVQRPFEAERAAGVMVVDLIRKRGLGYLNTLAGPGSPSPSDRSVANLPGLFVPSGWLYLEEYNLCRAYQTLLDGTIDPSQRRVFPDRTEGNVRDFGREIRRDAFVSAFIHHRTMGALLLPALSRVVVKVATAQTAVDQAALACALERYRLANGQFPEKLEALVPRFISQLPHDVITGAPYKYRRTADGQFVLYSVGWNQTDDGGVPGKTLFDEKEGDWVWQYPEPTIVR